MNTCIIDPEIYVEECRAGIEEILYRMGWAYAERDDGFLEVYVPKGAEFDMFCFIFDD